MGSLDVPPPHTPPWVVPAHSACLGIAFLLWSAAYALMTRRALATRSHGMPLRALATNVSWEAVNLLYVCEMPLEKAGLALWLLLDVGLVYTAVRFGPDDDDDYYFAAHPWVRRRIGLVLALLTAAGLVAQGGFAAWWLAVPGRGFGSKAGKWWRGREGFDTTELAFWTSGVSQVIASYECLAMLRKRGHSGGTGYRIWLCRALGTVIGPVLGYIPMWWYWPEAHGFVASPAAILIWGTAIVCDLIYPFVLRRVRESELVLPDGRLARGRGTGVKPKMSAYRKKNN